MGPLLPAYIPTPGAANGLPDPLRRDEELVVPGALLLRTVDRQTSAVGLELRSGTPPVQHQPQSDRFIHHIDIDIQAGGEQHDFVSDPVRDHAKTGPDEGSGDDGITDASASTSSDPSRHVPTSDDHSSSTSDDDVSSDGSSSSENDDDDEEAATSSTSSSAISSTSSLDYSASSSSSEASTLTTASSRRNGHQAEVGGAAGGGGGGDDGGAAAALVLIGCRMCLTYYMVRKPAGGCPRCGHQGDHIVRFGG